MAIVLTSTTDTQENMDHAASEKWREAPEVKPKAEPAPEVEPEQEPVEVPEEPNAEPAEPAEEPETETEAAEAKPRHKSGWQKRIDKLTARNHQLENRIAEFEAKARPAEEARPFQLPQEPKWAEYQAAGKSIDEFLRDRDTWKDVQAGISRQEEMKKAINDAYNEKASKALGEYEDWSEVVSSSKVILPQDAIDAIKEVDNGPAVAYYLAQHPEEAEALNEFTPKRAVLEIGRISDKLTAEKEKPAPKPKVVPPAPITPVTSSGTKTSTPLEKMSMREYIKIRNKQEREARRG